MQSLLVLEENNGRFHVYVFSELVCQDASVNSVNSSKWSKICRISKMYTFFHLSNSVFSGKIFAVCIIMAKHNNLRLTQFGHFITMFKTCNWWYIYMFSSQPRLVSTHCGSHQCNQTKYRDSLCLVVYFVLSLCICSLSLSHYLCRILIL